MPKPWFKFSTPYGDLYSYYNIPATEYISFSKDKLPTAAEIAGALNSKAIDGLVYSAGGKIGYKEIPGKLDQEPVELPAGAYVIKKECMHSPEGLMRVNIREDSSVKRKLFHNLAEQIQDFVAAEDIYREIGTQYKRGILLYGPPGEGKTVIIRQLVEDALPKDTRVVFFHSLPSSRMLEQFKGQKAGLTVFVFEELAAVLDKERMYIDRILDFLDGETSVDHSIVIATTNYPERLPMNIIDRPSRFDLLIKVGHPDKEEVKVLVEHFLGKKITSDRVSSLVGFSTAFIKECCLLTRMKKIPLAHAVKIIKERHNQATDFGEKKEVGLKDTEEIEQEIKDSLPSVLKVF